MPGAYMQGDLVRVAAVFYAGGNLTDPTTVTLRYKNPAGTTTVWVYLTDSQVVRDSLGQFSAEINANAGGKWYFRWEGTGAAQASNQDEFTVTAANA